MNVVTICVALLISQFSFAQEPQFAPQPAESTMADPQPPAVQQNRPNQGRVKSIKARAKKDGKVTRSERKKIKRVKNQAHAIRKKKNK